MPDILIRNGDVVDGTGARRLRADVVVQGDTIEDIGVFPDAQADRIIDATGCVVCPGFVDMHSHSDFTLPINPTSDSAVHQGITTEVVGQCGFSPAPLREADTDEVIKMLGGPLLRPIAHQWKTFGEFLAFLSRTGISPNAAPLVGAGMVRNYVMGMSSAQPRPDEIRRMQEAVAAALDQGAIGVSTGLVYPPGYYAGTDELVEVMQPLKEKGGLYFSHIRGEGTHLLDAVAEAIAIGRAMGVPVEISHFKAKGSANWEKSAQALDMIASARDQGLDVSADMYPYTACSHWVADCLPQWAREGGSEAVVSRLRDPATRRRIADEISASDEPDDPEKIVICDAPGHRKWEGRTIRALADDAGKASVEWVFDALIASNLDMSEIDFVMSEENKANELRFAPMMIGTDGNGMPVEGPLAVGKPHPRSFGTFPRVLGHYVRERGVLSLEEAIHKMSGLPASKLGWSDRGLVRPGHRADLVVLDPATVQDRATFEQPFQYPIGIRMVLVNGEVVVRDGVHTGARPGWVLGHTVPKRA